MVSFKFSSYVCFSSFIRNSIFVQKFNICPVNDILIGFKSKPKNFSKQKFNGGKCARHQLLMIRAIYYTFVMLNLIPDTPQFDQIVLIVSQINFT